MSLQKKIDLPLSDKVTAFYTCRGTHTADNPYSGFNACHYVGDAPSHVSDCRHELCRHLGIELDHLIIPRQTHSTNVAVITSISISNLTFDETDALVTNLPGLAICINTADCVPIVLADIRAGVIAVVHSGWRGTVAGIAAKAISAMVRLGAEATQIHAVMGPCICCDCFEVGDEVAEQFIKGGFPDNVIKHQLPRPHIDLSAAIVHTLVTSGIPKVNILMPPTCPRCNDDLFSARRLGIASGRTLTVAMLRH